MKSQNTVYICTRDRYANLEKVVPLWIDQNFRIVLIVEPDQEEDHDLLCSDMSWFGKNVFVEPLFKSNQGIGYARSYAVWHASQDQLKSIIMADDDVRPAMDSDMSLLINEAKKTEVLGIGAVLRIHDHFTGGAVSANSGVMLCPGGWGHRLYGLNVNKTMLLGNFDKKLDVLGEDDELQRNGIVAGIPWAVHCDVWSESIGSRFQPGGIQALAGENRSSREERNHMYLHKRWPSYIKKPPNKFRMAWQRMLTDFIPNWKERSAIHGGSW